MGTVLVDGNKTKIERQNLIYFIGSWQFNLGMASFLHKVVAFWVLQKGFGCWALGWTLLKLCSFSWLCTRGTLYMKMCSEVTLIKHFMVKTQMVKGLMRNHSTSIVFSSTPHGMLNLRLSCDRCSPFKQLLLVPNSV